MEATGLRDAPGTVTTAQGVWTPGNLGRGELPCTSLKQDGEWPGQGLAYTRRLDGALVSTPSHVAQASLQRASRGGKAAHPARTTHGEGRPEANQLPEPESLGGQGHGEAQVRTGKARAGKGVAVSSVGLGRLVNKSH